MSEHRRYWDSDVFLGWFNAEDGRVQDCRDILYQAEAGDLTIVTSAVTLTEVLFPREETEIRLSPDDEDEIRRFFENEFIELYNADRKICEVAQTLVWEYGVRPKDCIHAATASVATVDTFDAYDSGLLQMDGELPGEDGSSIPISPPKLIGHTRELNFPESSNDAVSEEPRNSGKESR